MRKSALKIATFVCLGLASAAFADKEAGMDDGPCKQDMQTHCKDVKPGEGRILKCIADNGKNFSKDCKAHLFDKRLEMRDRRMERREGRRERREGKAE